jgi:hypothetical protein
MPASHGAGAQSPRGEGSLSPTTRKLIENLAQGSVIGDQDGGGDGGGGGVGGGGGAKGGSDGGARAAAGPSGTGPMQPLYPARQMLPVGHALQFLGAQQLQSLPAAQQMMMFYLQGQHASYLQQAAMGNPPHPPPPQSQPAAAAEAGSDSQVSREASCAALRGRGGVSQASCAACACFS